MRVMVLHAIDISNPAKILPLSDKWSASPSHKFVRDRDEQLAGIRSGVHTRPMSAGAHSLAAIVVLGWVPLGASKDLLRQEFFLQGDQA